MKTTAPCDACIHYDHYAEAPCLLGHRPRFYLPTARTVLNQQWGHRRACTDFKPAGEPRRRRGHGYAREGDAA